MPIPLEAEIDGFTRLLLVIRQMLLRVGRYHSIAFHEEYRVVHNATLTTRYLGPNAEAERRGSAAAGRPKGLELSVPAEE